MTTCETVYAAVEKLSPSRVNFFQLLASSRRSCETRPRHLELFWPQHLGAVAEAQVFGDAAVARGS